MCFLVNKQTSEKKLKHDQQFFCVSVLCAFDKPKSTATYQSWSLKQIQSQYYSVKMELGGLDVDPPEVLIPSGPKGVHLQS